MKSVTLFIIFSLFIHAQVIASELSNPEKKESETIETCDPIVSVTVNQKMRSEVLKELGQKHDFQVQLPESEDSLISIEKEDKLSNVIESITRNSSVSLRYAEKDGCKQLAEIIFLKNQQWSGFKEQTVYPQNTSPPYIPERSVTQEKVDTTTGGILGSRSKNFQLNFTPKKVTRAELEEEMYMDEEKQEIKEEREMAIQSERERLEEKRKAAAQRNDAQYQPKIKINNIIQDGESLNADYYAGRKDWKSTKGPVNTNSNDFDVENMEGYVREVLNGERIPKGTMNAKERFEYLKALKRIQSND